MNGASSWEDERGVLLWLATICISVLLISPSSSVTVPLTTSSRSVASVNFSNSMEGVNVTNTSLEETQDKFQKLITIFEFLVEGLLLSIVAGVGIIGNIVFMAIFINYRTKIRTFHRYLVQDKTDRRHYCD